MPRKGSFLSNELEGSIVGDKYKVGKCLMKGSFGETRIVTSTQDSSKTFCAKFEKRGTKNSSLIAEEKYYLLIQLTKGVAERFPKYYGLHETENFRVLVLELLGPNLEELFVRCNKTFTTKTVLQLALQLMETIKALHECDIVHRDIKPENFLLGLTNGPNSKRLHVLDFGLALKYTDSNGNHIQYKENRGKNGTARYMSTNALQGCEQSRRDDLMSIAYMLVYFVKGCLPWQGCKVSRETAMTDGTFRNKLMEKILDMKTSLTTGALCQGVPRSVRNFIRLIRDLSFSEEPSYDRYKQLFMRNAVELDISLDQCYDWDTPSEESVQSSGTVSANMSNLKVHESLIGSPTEPKDNAMGQDISDKSANF
ncbi:Casein kinase I -like protein RAG8 [Halotydeus destructor]|nr:Casein kinase I -like protein RAG8 [Halotydeus destructor]